MAWSIYTHADVSRIKPRPLAVCDRCGFVYNHDRLRWQYDWVGSKIRNKRILVCYRCMDKPQEQIRTLKIPVDPVYIANPRPGEFSGMVISSSPDAFDTIVPNQIVTQVYQFDPANPLAATTIGTRTPIVTEISSLPLLAEVTVTPNPDPNYMGTVGTAGRDGGYTRMLSSNGTMVST